MSKTIDTIINFAAQHSSRERYQLPEEKRIEGDPEQVIENHYSSPCGQFHTGVWQSEAGSWRIQYTEHEYCEILEGSSVITDDNGQSMTVAVGDRFVIPAGFKGTWSVPEHCRKVYVIFESAGQG
jgi:uncharacterized protein